jgi:ABC-type multidrug transport system fused ATPase/permease subunit
MCGLSPLASRHPLGLQAQIEESGSDLSGGQRQRVALARAILRNPAVLVLDEATSALDSDSERRIFDRLSDWMAERTTIIMAHRLSTVRRVPRIIVLAGGRVVEQGPPDELMQDGSVFHSLFEEQLDGSGRDVRRFPAG